MSESGVRRGVKASDLVTPAEDDGDKVTVYVALTVKKSAWIAEYGTGATGVADDVVSYVQHSLWQNAVPIAVGPVRPARRGR